MSGLHKLGRSYKYARSSPSYRPAAAYVTRPDVYTAPSRVVVLRARNASMEFRGNVRSVAVTGGTRRVPIYDAEMSIIDAPTACTVVLTDGSTHYYGKSMGSSLDGVNVYGGTRSVDPIFALRGATVGTLSDGASIVGLHMLGSRCPDYQPAMVVGMSISEYAWGETQFKELESYFKAVGSPQQFQAAFSSLKGGYDDAATAWAIRAFITSDKMKTVGEQSVKFRKQIEAWAVSQGRGAAPPATVPDAPPPPGGVGSLLPWWGWGLIVVGGVGAVAVYAVPAIAPAITAAVAARRLAK